MPQAYVTGTPAYGPQFPNGSVLSYDKETERRILNNPYIILPSDLGNNDRSKNAKLQQQQQQQQQPYKSKRMYQNGNGSGASIGRSTYPKGQKP